MEPTVKIKSKTFFEQVLQAAVELNVECPIKWVSELILASKHAMPTTEGEPVLSQRYLRRQLGIFRNLLQRSDNCDMKFISFNEELKELPLAYYGIHQATPIINLCVASLAAILFKTKSAKVILDEVDVFSYPSPHLTGYLKRAEEWAVAELQTKCVKNKDKNKRFMTTIKHGRLEESLSQEWRIFCSERWNNRLCSATKRYFQGVLQMMLGFEEECFLQKFEEASQLQPVNYFWEFIMRRHLLEIRRRTWDIMDFVNERKSVSTPSRKEVFACKRAYELYWRNPVVAFDYALLEKELFLGTALELQDGEVGEDSTEEDNADEHLGLKVLKLFRNVLRLVPRRSEFAKRCHLQIFSLFADQRLGHLPKTMLTLTFHDCLRFWSEDKEILLQIEGLILAGKGNDLVGSTFLRQVAINFPYFKKCAKVASQLKQFDWLINVLDSDIEKIEAHRPNQIGKFLFLKGLCYWFNGDNKSARATWNDVTSSQRLSLKKLNLPKFVRALCFECVVSYKRDRTGNAIIKILKQIIGYGRVPHDNLGNIPMRASLKTIRFRIYKPARQSKLSLPKLAKNWAPDPCQTFVPNHQNVYKSKMEVIQSLQKLNSEDSPSFCDMYQVRVDVTKSKITPQVQCINGRFGCRLSSSADVKVTLLDHSINCTTIFEIRNRYNSELRTTMNFVGVWLINASWFITRVALPRIGVGGGHEQKKFQSEEKVRLKLARKEKAACRKTVIFTLTKKQRHILLQTKTCKPKSRKAVKSKNK